MLSQVCFAWFMSVGPEDIDTSKLQLEQEKAKDLNILINAIRKESAPDIVDLLTAPSVREFIKKSTNSYLVSMHDSMHENNNDMIILRTENGEDGHSHGPATKYVWVRFDGQIHLSMAVFKFSGRAESVKVESVSQDGLSSFKLDGNEEIDYFAMFHFSQFASVMQGGVYASLPLLEFLGSALAASYLFSNLDYIHTTQHHHQFPRIHIFLMH
jgi:hypothetical protein